MITFSVNVKIDEHKLKKIHTLISQVNDSNSDYLSDAYINIVCGSPRNKDIEDKNINLTSIQYVGKAHEATAQKQSPVILWDDFVSDDDSEDKVDIYSTDSFEDAVVEKMDYEKECEEVIEKFIRLREEIFISRGSDIWRLLSLSHSGDKPAMKKLQLIFCNPDDRELLSKIILDRHIYKKLKDIM